MSVRPLFLFSLPRSGSTLVQRVLASRGEVSTVSEPWILLPFFYTLKPHGVYAEYSHRSLHQAVHDFCWTLPQGEREFKERIAGLARGLYQSASSPGATYFLDKTPRYHLIAEEILEAFPEARIVFLWRNPLAVASSMINTWAEGRWNLYRSRIDLYVGIEGLVQTFSKHRDRVHATRYEDLVGGGSAPWKAIFDYLELSFDPAVLEDFSSVKLGGRWGDKSHGQESGRIQAPDIPKWRSTLGNPLRKAWARRYLRWIGSERLALMGYDLSELLSEVAETPTSVSRLLSDAARMTFGAFYPFLEREIWGRKWALVPDWRRIVAHR